MICGPAAGDASVSEADCAPAQTVAAKVTRRARNGAALRCFFRLRRSAARCVDAVLIGGRINHLAAFFSVSQSAFEICETRFDVQFLPLSIDDVLAVAAQEIVDGLDADPDGTGG